MKHQNTRSLSWKLLGATVVAFAITYWVRAPTSQFSKADTGFVRKTGEVSAERLSHQPESSALSIATEKPTNSEAALLDAESSGDRAAAAAEEAARAAGSLAAATAQPYQ